MGKLDRAHWGGMNTSLQNAYEKAEDAGDEKAMKKIYRRIEDHHDNQSVVDKAAGFVDDMRELPAAIRDARR